VAQKANAFQDADLWQKLWQRYSVFPNSL